MVPFIPNYLIYRYGTLLNSSEVHGGEAENSTNARKEVLNESLGLTLKHPVVGVGPGQFRVAAAAQSKDEGVRALWLETHNTYTQISSETGIVGLLLYLSMIFFSLVPVWKDLRLARRTGNRLPQHEYARALLICSAGLLTNCIFTSVAYQYYWPLLCGLGVAYQRVTNTRTTTATPFRLMRTPAVS
jgi:O-antigen ligase